MGGARDRDRRRHRHRPAARAAGRSGRRRRARRRARRRLSALRPRACGPCGAAVRGAGGDARRGSRRARDAARAAREPEHRVPPAALPAVRLDRAVAHRAPAGDADAAVLRLPGGNAIAVAIDGSGRRVAADPYKGTIENVLECAANLACVGAEPLGLTNCLNFGNPEKPHIAWQLSESIRGLGDACRALGVPVVGGNVSLYNEGAEGPIYPTPVVGLVGGLPDAARAGALAFAREGDAVGLVGPFAPALPASELAQAPRRGAARWAAGRRRLRRPRRARGGARRRAGGRAVERARRRRGRRGGRARGVRARRRHRRARHARGR